MKTIAMSAPMIVLNILFIPSMIVGNAMLFWVFGELKQAGIWPTEKFFGFERRRRFQLFNVIQLLKQRIQKTNDAVELRQYRQWLGAIYWGYGLYFFAMATLLAFFPWLYLQAIQQ